MRIARCGITYLTLLFALATVPAAARDRAPLNAYNAPVVAVYEWTGFYIGGNIGGSFGTARSNVSATGLPSTVPLNETMNGVVGGLQLGYNGRFDRLFFGIETDFQGTSQRGRGAVTDIIPGIAGTPGTPLIPGTPAIPCVLFDPPAPACTPGTGIPGTPDIPATPGTPGTPAVTGIISYQNQLPWFGTVRGRFGFTPVDRWWLYVTGGLAYGDVITRQTLTANGVLATSVSDTIKLGWVVGAGIETFIWNGWTLKLEYLYIDFGNIGPTTLAGIAPIAVVAGSNHLTDNIVRVGFNYHFAASTPWTSAAQQL